MPQKPLHAFPRTHTHRRVPKPQWPKPDVVHRTHQPSPRLSASAPRDAPGPAASQHLFPSCRTALSRPPPQTQHDHQQAFLGRPPRRLPSTASPAKGCHRPVRHGVCLHTRHRLTAKPRPRQHHALGHSNGSNTHNHHQGAVAIARPDHRIRPVNRPLPAHETARASLQPLHLAQDAGLPHTRRFTPQPPWVR